MMDEGRKNRGLVYILLNAGPERYELDGVCEQHGYSAKGFNLFLWQSSKIEA